MAGNRIVFLLGVLYLAALLTASAAKAVSATVKQRTAFCREAKAECQAIFFLTASDEIQIESHSIDGKWLKVKHLATGQIGWIAATDVLIKAPNRLQPEIMRQLDVQELALVPTPKGLTLLGKDRLLPVSGSELPLKGLADLKPDSLRVIYTSAEELRVFGLIEIEKQLFLQEVQPALMPHPRYQTLLRFDKGPYGMAWLPENVLLVLGAGQASWGKSLLLGLDQNYLPVMLLREPAEVLSFMPEPIRQGLRGESFRLHDLESDGGLVASAYHSGLRREMLLLLRPRPGENQWAVDAQLLWPKQLPFRANSPGLHLRLWHQGNQSFLLVRTDTSGEGFLAYYSGGNEAQTLQRLEEPILDAGIFEGLFWTLNTDSLVRWSPVDSED